MKDNQVAAKPAALVRVLQPARTNRAIVHPVSPAATASEVTTSADSCVVHLCGCK